RGSNPSIDLSISAAPAIDAFLQQGIKQIIDMNTTLETVNTLASGIESASAINGGAR
ncbi:MAG: flagellum-specific ATP synthase, partial [Yoonia sp.]